nr:hypothetical protein DGKKSRWO_DGKKSRWO_CDS_0189 [uncultured phage]CAI9752367.1 hypothetical protein CVNMHQAP_CVNMHQAP_CDS_0190 [uncultured phage]
MAKKILMLDNKVVTTSGGAITFDVKNEQEKTVDLSMASGNQVISPDSEKVLSKVTVNKPTTLIPANIKKDVNIGGVVGTLESSGGGGDTSETWVLNDPITNNITDAVASLATPEFTVEGISYTGFAIQRVRLDLYFNYVNSNTSTQAMYLGLADVGYSFIRWNNQAYRKLTFATPPTGELLTWLQANGVKQEKNLAIQPFAIQRVRLDLYFNYVNSNTSTQAMYLGLADVGYSFIRWNNQAYRKLTFATPPTGELLTWLQANGVKQEKNLAIQPSKSLTITSNGTTTITPDAPYDGMGQVEVTVNAGGSAGYKVTFPATATNWSKLGTSCLIYADGTTSTHTDYSTLAGKTFESVVAMVFGKNGRIYYQLKATLSSGAIILYSQSLVPLMVSVTFAPDTTPTPMGTAINFNWIPIADTVISAIEAYNTD